MGAACGTSGRVDLPVEISFSPLQTEEGVVITSAIRDISERRRRRGDPPAQREPGGAFWADEALLKSNEELQRFALRRQPRLAGAAGRSRFSPSSFGRDPAPCGGRDQSNTSWRGLTGWSG